MRSLIVCYALVLWFTGVLSASPIWNRLRRLESLGSLAPANSTANATAATTDLTVSSTSTSTFTSTSSTFAFASSSSLPLSSSSFLSSAANAPTPIQLGKINLTPTAIGVGKISGFSQISETSSTSQTTETTRSALVGKIQIQPIQIGSSDESPTPIPLGTLTSTTTTSKARGPLVASIALPSAVSFNATQSASSPLVTADAPPFPLGNKTTAPYPFGNATASSGAALPSGTAVQDVCGGCTVYARGASVDYWFPATYSYALGKLNTVRSNNATFLTLAPATTTFDVASAINAGAYTTTVSYFPEWDFYVTLMDSYTLTPGAVSTAVISRSSVLPVTGTVGINDVDYLSVDPGPATVAVPLPSGTASIATSTTPFVYFSAYQVERLAQSTQVNGQVVCSTATATFNMSTPYAFDYTGDSVEEATTVEGDLPDDFINQIPQSSCVAGQWYGEVTVLVVVDLIYDIQFLAEPFVQHVESAVSTTGFPVQTGGLKPEAGQLPSSSAVGNDGSSAGLAESSAGAGPIQSSVGANPIQSSASPAQSPGGGGGIGGVIASIIGASATVVPGAGNGGLQPNLGSLVSSSQIAPTAIAVTKPQPGGGVSIQPTPSVIVIGTNTASIGSSSQVIIGTQTLTPGGPAITVDNTPVSLAPSATAIVIGGTTSIVAPVTTDGGVVVVVPSPTSAIPVLTIGSTTVTGNAATQFFFGPGSTLTPGGTVVLGGTTVSLDQSASFVVIGGTTQVLPTPAPSLGSIFTVSGTAITGNSGNTFVFQGQTLTPGGSAITVDGPDGKTTISLVAGGSSVVINGATQPVTPVITPAPLVIGGSTFTVTDGSTFVSGTETLKPGDVVTITDSEGQKTTVSLGPSASFVVVNGVTSTLVPGALTTQAPLLTIGGVVYTALPGGTTYVIDGTTLAPGSSIVVSGTTISLSPYATALVVNGHTTTLFPATTTRTGPLPTATLSRSGISAETPSDTGAAANPSATSKSVARTLRSNNKLLTVGVSAFLGALVTGIALWL